MASLQVVQCLQKDTISFINFGQKSGIRSSCFFIASFQGIKELNHRMLHLRLGWERISNDRQPYRKQFLGSFTMSMEHWLRLKRFRYLREDCISPIKSAIIKG